MQKFLIAQYVNQGCHNNCTLWCGQTLTKMKQQWQHCFIPFHWPTRGCTFGRQLRLDGWNMQINQADCSAKWGSQSSVGWFHRCCGSQKNVANKPVFTWEMQEKEEKKGSFFANLSRLLRISWRRSNQGWLTLTLKTLSRRKQDRIGGKNPGKARGSKCQSRHLTKQ